jgi:hypothetical protein
VNFREGDVIEVVNGDENRGKIDWKSGIGMALLSVDNFWKFVGARHGVELTQSMGDEFEGWH